MERNSKPIPARLRNDAILEASFEIRFSMSSPSEVFFGRIVEFAPWKDFNYGQLPLYQAPAALRDADPNLRVQPIFSLNDGSQQRAVRVGPRTISYSRGVPYVGWKVFKPELEEVIEAAFKADEKLQVERLGLRYLNALRPSLHGITSIADLDLRIEVAGERITESVNVNATTDRTGETACTVRIATADVIQGNLPPDTSVYVDVDVFTSDGFKTDDKQFVQAWIERAHTTEKRHFFDLLKESTIESLREV